MGCSSNAGLPGRAIITSPIFKSNLTGSAVLSTPVPEASINVGLSGTPFVAVVHAVLRSLIISSLGRFSEVAHATVVIRIPQKNVSYPYVLQLPLPTHRLVVLT